MTSLIWFPTWISLPNNIFNWWSNSWKPLTMNIVIATLIIKGVSKNVQIYWVNKPSIANPDSYLNKGPQPKTLLETCLSWLFLAISIVDICNLWSIYLKRLLTSLLTFICWSRRALEQQNQKFMCMLNFDWTSEF